MFFWWHSCPPYKGPHNQWFFLRNVSLILLILRISTYQKMTFTGQMIKVKTPYRLAFKEAYQWTRISQRLWGGLFSIGKHPATTYNTIAATFKEQTSFFRISQIYIVSLGKLSNAPLNLITKISFFTVPQ